MKGMTGQLQRHPAPGRSDNPQDLVRVRPGVTGHQRVTEQEPRRLPSPGEGIPDGRGIRRRRPPRRGPHEQRRRAASAADIRCTWHGRRAGRPAGLRSAGGALRRGAGTSRQRSMARGACRDQDSAPREHQAGDPGHAMTINADPRGDKDPVPASSSAERFSVARNRCTGAVPGSRRSERSRYVRPEPPAARGRW